MKSIAQCKIELNNFDLVLYDQQTCDIIFIPETEEYHDMIVSLFEDVGGEIVIKFTHVDSDSSFTQPLSAFRETLMNSPLVKINLHTKAVITFKEN